MEVRNLKIMFQKSGSGSVNTRIAIPLSWVREIGANEKEREVKVMFDGQKITIQKLECNRFYDKSIVNMENLKKVLVDDGTNGDMTTEEIATVKAFTEYNSEEDMEYLLEKLLEKKQGEYAHNDINLQTIYEIISIGEWNYNS